MSIQKFDDECPGCRPAMMNIQTGKVLSEDSPQMQCVLGIWAETTREEREAFHRVTCLNSRHGNDVRIMTDLSTRMAKALQSMSGGK